MVPLIGLQRVERFGGVGLERIEQGVPFPLQGKDVFLMAADGGEFPLGRLAPLVELREPRPELLESYEVLCDHLLVARPLALNLGELLGPQLPLLVGVSPRLSSIILSRSSRSVVGSFITLET